MNLGKDNHYQSYNNINFERYNFDSLDELLPGVDNYLDHLCNCILDPENTVVEGWTDVVDDFQAGPPHNMAKEKV